jgi:hypothetical protein
MSRPSCELDQIDAPHPFAREYGIAAFAAFDLRSSSIPLNVTTNIREHSRAICVTLANPGDLQ